MRRLYIDRGFSKAVYWSVLCLLLALIFAALIVVFSRHQIISLAVVLSLLSFDFLLDLLALMLAIRGLGAIWHFGDRGLIFALASLFGGWLFLLAFGYFGYLSLTLPALTDITTDFNDPLFISSSQNFINVRQGWPPPQSVLIQDRPKQYAAYPDIQPILTPQSMGDSYKIVMKAINRLGWKIVDTHVPWPNDRQAFVLLQNHGFILGLEEEILVRLRALPNQTRIDLRVIFPEDHHDFGAGAARINAFSQQWDALNSN